MFLGTEVFSTRTSGWIVLQCGDTKTVKMAKNNVMSDGSLDGQEELVVCVCMSVRVCKVSRPASASFQMDTLQANCAKNHLTRVVDECITDYCLFSLFLAADSQSFWSPLRESFNQKSCGSTRILLWSLITFPRG